MKERVRFWCPLSIVQVTFLNYALSLGAQKPLVDINYYKLCSFHIQSYNSQLNLLQWFFDYDSSGVQRTLSRGKTTCEVAYSKTKLVKTFTFHGVRRHESSCKVLLFVLEPNIPLLHKQLVFCHVIYGNDVRSQMSYYFIYPSRQGLEYHFPYRWEPNALMLLHLWSSKIYFTTWLEGETSIYCHSCSTGGPAWAPTGRPLQRLSSLVAVPNVSSGTRPEARILERFHKVMNMNFHEDPVHVFEPFPYTNDPYSRYCRFPFMWKGKGIHPNCTAGIIQIQTLAHRFNFTLLISAYYRNNGYSRSQIGVPGHRERDTLEPGEVFHLIKAVDYFLVYCTDVGTKDYSSFFETLGSRAADTPTWIFALVCYTIGGLLTQQGNVILGIYTAISMLLRQEAPGDSFSQRKPNAKMYTFLTLMATILSSGYEGFLTSTFTVPPPPTIINDLTELLDLGYLIYEHRVHGLSPTSILNYEVPPKYFIPFLQSRNMYRLNQSFYFGSALKRNHTRELLAGEPRPEHMDPRMVQKNSKGSTIKVKVAKPLSRDTILPLLAEMKTYYPSKSCHRVREDKTIIVSSNGWAWYFHHYYSAQFYRVTKLIDEAGIPAFLSSVTEQVQSSIWDTVNGLEYKINLRSVSEGPKAIAISGNVQNLFIVLIFLLGGSTLIFVLELILDRNEKSANICWIWVHQSARTR